VHGSLLTLNFSSTRAFFNTYPLLVLPWWGMFNGTQTPGLLNNSLYEILENTTLTNGKAQVSAIGFNITCGYLPAVIIEALDSDPLPIDPYSDCPVGFTFDNQLGWMVLSCEGMLSPCLNNDIHCLMCTKDHISIPILSLCSITSLF
jgi:hypothetical protein